MTPRDKLVIAIVGSLMLSIDMIIKTEKRMHDLTPQEMYAIRKKLAQELVAETETVNTPE